MLINFPRPKFAIVPVSLALALVRFSATASPPPSHCTKTADNLYIHAQLTLEITPPLFASSPDVPFSTPAATLSLSLHPDFILELASTSLIGSRAKLQDIPKVEQLVVGRVRAWVIENLVWPKVRTVKLPSMASRKKEEKDSGERKNEKDEFVFFNQKRGRSGERGNVASAEMDSSAIDDDEDEAETCDAGKLETTTRVTVPDPPSTASSSSSSQFVNGEPFASAKEDSRSPHRSDPRQSRRFSASSSDPLSSTGTSTTTAASPPDLSSDSTTTSDLLKDAYREAVLRHRTPLHSPGLGMAVNPRAVPPIRSPLQRSGSSLSGADMAGTRFFDMTEPRWDAARKAARERRSLSPLQDMSFGDDI